LNSLSEAFRQEQRESLRPPSITTPSPDMPRLIDEVARIMNSKLKTVPVRTSEKRINERTGKEEFVTEPRTILVEKQTITAADRKAAEDVILLDRLSADDLIAEVNGQTALGKINKPGLVKYWDYLSKRDRGVGLTDAQMAQLTSFTKNALRQKVIDFKMNGVSPFGEPLEMAREKSDAKESTASQIEGISAGASLNIIEKARTDYAARKILSEGDFANLNMDDQLEYMAMLNVLGALDGDLNFKMDFEGLIATPESIKAATIPRIYKQFKEISGMGMKKKGKSKNIVFGCGLSKSVGRVKKTFTEKIDFSEGLPKDKSYIPFGKYVIHKHKLTGGILQVRTINGGAIPKLPTLGISPSLGKIIKKMVGGGLPTYDEMSALNEDDKNTLYKVFKLSQIDKADMIPSPDKTKEEQEMNRFQILKGQIQAGNDNAELIKEFKRMLMKFISGGKIPRGQGMEIVCDLMALGY